MEPTLQIKKLNISFESRDGRIRAVCDVDLTIRKGSVVGLIGETGCGKSTLGKSVLRLLPSNARLSGEIVLDGGNLLDISKQEIRKVRGRRVAYICQNPQEALNPVIRNGKQIMESVRINQRRNRNECRKISMGLLKTLNFSNPETCMAAYPMHLSGGMKQRVLAAMGMSGCPSLLIADEPTGGLDALIRGQVIATVEKFIETTGSAALIITHDLTFARAICDEIAVMYAGEIVEMGKTDELFADPRHPYLKALIASQPGAGLRVLKGTACSLLDLPPGCRFYERCSSAAVRCRETHPDLIRLGRTREARCLKFD